MPVRSARLAARNSGIGAIVVAYTCPPGVTALVKDIRISALNGAVVRASVLLLSGAQNTSVIDRPLANLEVFSIQGFMVLEPGDRIQTFAGGGGQDFQIWVSGAELQGLAP